MCVASWIDIMSRRPARFTEADFRRVLKVIKEMGENVLLQILPDGTFHISCAQGQLAYAAEVPTKPKKKV